MILGHRRVAQPVVMRRVYGSPAVDAGWTLDFSALAESYAGIEPTLTGTAILARGASTAAIVTGASNPCYERRGDEPCGGVWACQSATNEAPDPVALDTGGGWLTFGSPTVTTEGTIAAPDGTLTARGIEDSNAGAQACVYTNLAQSPRLQSIWYRYLTTAPTQRAGLGRTGLATTVAGLIPAKTDEVWHRFVTRFTTGAQSTQFAPAPSAWNDAATSQNGGTGKMLFWGAASYSTLSAFDLPCFDGTGAATKPLAAAHAADTVRGGAFDLDVELIPSCYDWTLQADGRFFGGSSPDGELSLWWDLSERKLVFVVRGSTVLTTTTNVTAQFSTRQQIHRARAWYDPATGAGGVRTAVNGAWSRDETVVASGDPLAAPTEMWLGSSDGSTSFLNSRIVRARRHASLAPVAPEVVFLGDSLVGCFGNGTVAFESTASHVYTDDEVLTRPGLLVLAVASDTIAGQKSKWSAWVAAHAAEAVQIAAVVIRVSINDIIASMTSANAISGLQDLVDTVAADAPQAQIVLCELLPARTAIGETKYAVWLAVNEAIRGEGGSPITGADVIVLSASGGNGLNDGNDDIPTALAAADRLHHTSAGRIIDATAADVGGQPVSLRGGLVHAGALS